MDRERGSTGPVPARLVRTPPLVLFGSILSALLVVAPTAAQVNGGEDLPSDSASLRERAEELQAAFESYRESRIPPALATPGGRCDERIGRFCLRHDGDDRPIPDEPPEVGLARSRMLRDLGAIGSRIPGDGWVLGQRIFYLVESGNVRGAEDLVRSCRGPESWWCDALLGYVLHEDARTLAADSAFASAIETMPSEVREWYERPEFILDSDGRELFDEATGGERDELLDRLWLLSDPLFLVEGNDRRTAHLARKTLTRMRAGTLTAYGLPFDEDRDLEELNVRYGGERGYERIQGRPSFDALRDTRRIVGRHPPNDREYLPTGSFLADPAEIPPGAWTLEEPRPRTGYVAPYAESMRRLDAQLARFRRGDSLLVVASYRPARTGTSAVVASGAGRSTDRSGGRDDASGNPFLAPTPPVEDRAGATDRPVVDGGPAGPVTSGFFLLDWDGDPALDARGAAADTVVTARVPNGEYVVGLEVMEQGASRAWRVRQGLRQESLAPGQGAVSDLLFLRSGPDLPTSLEESLPRVLPAIRTRPGETFTVAWEVYGLRPGESAQVTLGFTEGEPGLLRRIGQFLRIVEPEDPVEIRFDDRAADEIGALFRALDVSVPSFEPGVYTLHLEVQLSGRTPMVTSRRLVVEEG